MRKCVRDWTIYVCVCVHVCVLTLPAFPTLEAFLRYQFSHNSFTSLESSGSV